jgi:hypothetical protein
LIISISDLKSRIHLPGVCSNGPFFNGRLSVELPPPARQNRGVNWKCICLSLFVGVPFGAVACDYPTPSGTAFTYQGRLNDGGSPANGVYDLTFSLYDGEPTLLAGPITNSAVVVTNGLFATAPDFGSNVFNGTGYWLGIGVRTNGSTNAFTLLNPLQMVTPVPYAIFATTASNLVGGLSTTQLVGTLPATAFAGYTNTVSLTNANNQFKGTFAGAFNGVFNGFFTGDGRSLTNLNGSQVTVGTVADARLSANVALLNTNQTFTGSNIFTGNNTFNGVNTFTNRGNSFIGSFFGNGLVGWIPVSGTATQAMVDAGYLLLNSGLTTVTLPPSLTVGDIVRVSGAGTGGWLVQVNSGQSILGTFASYNNCYPVALPATGSYNGIAISADGTRMNAVCNGNNNAGRYVSTDSGKTWTKTSTTSWQSIACSANGEIVYAEPSTGGTLQVSYNGGVTYSDSSFSAVTASSIACTSDGSKALTGNIACSGNGTCLAQLSSGVISISNNASGWVRVATNANFSCLAVSSDCIRLVAGANNGLLYASANRGATWTALTSTNQNWSGAWMSADGSKFAATVSSTTTGGIYYSSTSPQPNTIATNSICGSPGSAVELQYIGNSQFIPVSSSGILWAN